MRKLLFFLPFVGINLIALSQNKLLTIEDALVNNRTTLAPQNLKQLQFVYNTDDYVYLKKVEGTDVWMKGNMKGENSFLTLTRLNEKLRAGGVDTLKGMPSIQFNVSPEWIMTLREGKIALDPATNKVRVIIGKSITSKENVEESKAGYIAYLDSFNLYISDGKNAKKITTDGSKDIVYASSVHREEFGITKGTFWSNNGKQLAFYRMDQSMVTDYPIIDWTTTPAHNENIKYPMAGDKSHHVTVGVYNAQTNSLVYLKTGEPAEQYLTNIAWSPDDKIVYIAVLNREQNRMTLNSYDASTGDFIKTLFEEKDDKYVEPLVPMLFVKNHPDQFIWQSNRDGWNHLYLYDTNGKLIKQLTRGNWEVTEVKGFDAKSENLFYISTEESPVSRNLYSINLKSGTIKQLTKAYLHYISAEKDNHSSFSPRSTAVHLIQLSSDGKYTLDTYSTPGTSRSIQLIDLKHIDINSADLDGQMILYSENPLKNYRLGRMDIFTINNSTGTPLYCRMYKPINFDSTKKYPVIVYWYGGPHVQLITNSWNGGAGDYWFEYMAERGFIVFSLDPRGSDNRGKAFEQSIFRSAGGSQMDDLLDGVKYLNSLFYVDKNNMGLFGWSYGGFLTTDFMLTHPGVFKASVAGGPVTDWRYYEIMYGERYMDTPQENPEGYEATDLTKKIGNLKGKLLLIHGLQDNVVVQQHSVRLVMAAIDKGVQVDYMIYPGHEHNVLGRDRAHLYQKVTDYFTEHLK
jgi:dipeptidyl-peptidase 4